MRQIPRIVIAGTHSGAGKTSLTLGIVALLRRHGLCVQTFKVGPDYLDPTYLSAASERPCYNLDSWMTGRDYIECLFSRATANADIAVIEGVMGLFDGADSISADGSTAQIAQWLDAPILLVVDVSGLARSLAAAVHGYSTFDPDIRIAGIIANYCGSESHARGLREALEAKTLPPMLGHVKRGNLPELPGRHLGLINASFNASPSQLIQKLADALTPTMNIDEIIKAAQAASLLQFPTREIQSESKQCKLGIARDEAFHFYYPDNLEALEQAGCELVDFSPIHDCSLPDGLSGLYIGGGYPEEHAAALSANGRMLEEIRNFPGLIYAECGGLMYLAEGIETRDGARHSQVGLLPGWVRIGTQLKRLRYVEVQFSSTTFWGEKGATLRGHEYHYSELVHVPSWQTSYNIKPPRSSETFLEGFQKNNVLASYIHLHFASHPKAVQHFVRQMR
jgi:cobyrinic acid a,c-diamide synthase